MGSKSAALRITHSLLTLAGYAQETYMDERYWIEIPCSVCGEKFWIRKRVMEVRKLAGEREKVCSKSCVTKRMHEENPHVAQGMSLIGKGHAGNPSWNKGVPTRPETKALLSEQGKLRKAEFLAIRGGNGMGPTACELTLRPLLPESFQWNYPVPLGRRQEGYPTNYKLDYADPNLKIGIEVDGASHKSRASLDKKKEDKLKELGWSVLRISNSTIQRCTTSALREHLTSLLATVGR